MIHHDAEILVPYWHHLEELRKVLIKVLITIFAGVLLALLFHQQIFQFFSHLLPPLPQNQMEYELKPIKILAKKANALFYTLAPNEEIIGQSSLVFQISPHLVVLMPEGSLTLTREIFSQQLYITAPTEGLITLFKLCLWVGIAGTSPLWLLFCLQFIAPALHSSERKILLPFFTLSTLFIFAGILFALYILIPYATSYLLTLNLGTNIWTVTHYFDFTFLLLFSSIAVFELAAFGFLLVHLKILSHSWLIKKRRYWILISFCLGALLTPPDILTQILLASVLMIFYEIIILYARFTLPVHELSHSYHVHPETNATH